MVDPCAAFLVFVVTGLLCVGIKEVISLFIFCILYVLRSLPSCKTLSFFYAQSLQSTLAQAIVTTANVCALLFVIIAGAYLGFKTGWVGYELPTGYLHYLLLFSVPLSLSHIFL